MLFHDGQRRMPFLMPSWQLGTSWMVCRQMPNDVARRRNEGFVAVLLEEHPLQHLCTPQLAGRNVLRSFRQVPDDGVGLEQVDAIIKLHRGNPSIRESREELRCAGLTLVDIEFRPFVAQTELGKQQSNLVTIAGIQVVEDSHKPHSSES